MQRMRCVSRYAYRMQWAMLCFAWGVRLASGTISFPLITTVAFSASEISIPGMPMSIEFSNENDVVMVDSARKNVLVADAGNGSVWSSLGTGDRTPYSHTVCRAAGVSLVSFARSHAITTIALSDAALDTGQLNFKESLAFYPDTIIADLAASADCTTVYVLDGVHKRIYVLHPLEVARILPIRDLDLLVEPTGIHFSYDENELFVADWGGGAIWSVDLSISWDELRNGNGFSRVVGSVDGPGLLADSTETAAAILSGPTQMADFREGAGVIFTDRNPTLQTAAIRVLYTIGANRGKVRTLAGGNARGHVNGNFSSTLLGGCWGVAFNDHTHELLFTEPVSGVVRRLSDVEMSYAVCPVGEYEDVTRDGVCQTCDAGYVCPGDNVRHRCPSSLTSATGVRSFSQCWCRAGYMASGGACVPCVAGSYCAPFSNTSTRCPGETASPVGSSSVGECECAPGYYETSVGCALCTVGSYCLRGKKNFCELWPQTTSYPGASSSSDCLCKSGSRATTTPEGGLSCEACTDAEFCPMPNIVVEMSFNVFVPDGVDLTAVLDIDIFTSGFGAAMELNSWMVEYGTAVTVQRVLLPTDGMVLSPQAQTRRRVLLAISRGGRHLLQDLSWVNWEVMSRVLLGMVSPDAVSAYVERFNGIVHSGQIARIISASSGTQSFVENTNFIMRPETQVTRFAADGAPVACDAVGQVRRGNTCLCDAGFYGLPPTCLQCPKGTYSATAGVMSCQKCGEFQTTQKQAGKSEDACVCIDGYSRRVDHENGSVSCKKTNDTMKRTILIVSVVLGSVIICMTVFLGFMFTSNKRHYRRIVPVTGVEQPGGVLPTTRGSSRALLPVQQRPLSPGGRARVSMFSNLVRKAHDR